MRSRGHPVGAGAELPDGLVVGTVEAGFELAGEEIGGTEVGAGATVVAGADVAGTLELGEVEGTLEGPWSS